MSCLGCSTKFGVFTRELSCPKCKYSFCKKCLTYEHDTLRELRICSQCYSRLVGKPASSFNEELPDNFKRRLEVLKKGHSGKVSTRMRVTPHDPTESWTKGWSKEDEQLAERLKRLKEPLETCPKQPVSDIELSERLKKLRGYDAITQPTQTLDSAKKETFSSNAPALPEAKQVENLLDEILDEVKIESKQSGTNIDPHEGDDVSSYTGDPKVSSSTADTHALVTDLRTNEEKAVKDVKQLLKNKDIAEAMNRAGHSELSSSGEDSEEEMVVEEILAENALENDIAETSHVPRIAVDDTQDIDNRDTLYECPWCVLCNADAHVRCLDCDGDLYCERCFRDFHKDKDTRKHKTKLYCSKKG